jgi:hypothetical protein
MKKVVFMTEKIKTDFWISLVLCKEEFFGKSLNKIEFVKVKANNSSK